ncbi:MAG: MarR family transcriptional regulator [Lagierella massiliensis]|nr:MarR family transcriptional regulator [Lagierella massiliensis]
MQDIELKILIGLHKNVNTIDRKTIRLVKDNGLTLSQFMVLEALYSKGNMTVGEVRDRILSSIGTIPLIVNNLVKQGLVLRQGDENDRRIRILSLTDKGRAKIEKVLPKNIKLIKESMTNLTDSEKKELLYLLKKLGGKK